ncbi:MAG: hypothetical protein ACYSWW_20940 [Planctomycetota bacterium]|jgi:hypothetical protein
METLLEEKIQHNLECSCGSYDHHLCYLMSQGFHLSDEQEYKALIEDPEFQCGHCGRKANSNENLCVPAVL